MGALMQPIQGEHSDDGITNADSVQFTVVFDEPVTQVGHG